MSGSRRRAPAVPAGQHVLHRPRCRRCLVECTPSATAATRTRKSIVGATRSGRASAPGSSCSSDLPGCQRKPRRASNDVPDVDQVVAARPVRRGRVLERRDGLQEQEQPREPQPEVVAGQQLQQRVAEVLELAGSKLVRPGLDLAGDGVEQHGDVGERLMRGLGRWVRRVTEGLDRVELVAAASACGGRKARRLAAEVTDDRVRGPAGRRASSPTQSKKSIISPASFWKKSLSAITAPRRRESRSPSAEAAWAAPRPPVPATPPAP